MKVAVCYNDPLKEPKRGEPLDRISEEGARHEAEAVSQAVARLGHEPILLPLTADLERFLTALRQAKPDVVFNLCEGFSGESSQEMHVAALLELLGFPVTGSPPFTLGLTQDKVLTKELLERHGIPTPRWITVPPGERVPAHNLAWPLIVKPRAEDASLGVTAKSVVWTMAELRRQVTFIHGRYQQDALVEEYIDGRELNLAIIGNGTPDTLPASEIRFAAGSRRVVTYAGKWLTDSADFRDTPPRCPAPLTLAIARILKDLALAAYKMGGCRDYARIDFRLRNGEPFVLEINANPDISPDAGLARSAAAAGIGYDELISRILAMAAARREVSLA
jgi:D-alanine-D-alanine ligase